MEVGTCAFGRGLPAAATEDFKAAQFTLQLRMKTALCCIRRFTVVQENSDVIIPSLWCMHVEGCKASACLFVDGNFSSALCFGPSSRIL